MHFRCLHEPVMNSWDKTACIFKVAVSAYLLVCPRKSTESDGATVKDPAADHYVLYHERGFTEQIVWFVKSRHPYSFHDG
jgi:hypothetical protein